MLLTFIRARKDACLPLKSLKLVNIGHFSLESINQFRKAVPEFTYRTKKIYSSDSYYSGKDTESFEMYPPPRTVLYREPAGVIMKAKRPACIIEFIV